jgi:nucleotide-binding universal stress UspA family protein
MSNAASPWPASWLSGSGLSDLLVISAPTIGEALEMAEHARGPVAVVPPDWVTNDGPIVVATGHDLGSDAPIAPAIAIARHRAAPLVLVHVWGMPGTGTVVMPRDPYGVGSIPDGQAGALELLTSQLRLQHPDLVFRSEVRQSTHIAREILAAASNASAIVVGRGGTHARHPQLGHIARELVAISPCPVVIAPNSALHAR